MLSEKYECDHWVINLKSIEFLIEGPGTVKMYDM